MSITPRGIIIFGSSGSGTTTLGREVATQLRFPHYDIDDYIYRFDTEIPYTVTYPREERIRRLMSDISQFPHFVMSGSMDSFNAPFVPLFDLAVYNTVPAELRAERIRLRELERWGGRVLPGGDMYYAHGGRDYLAAARQYDSEEAKLPNRITHEKWAASLPCTVLKTDGVLPINENAKKIVECYLSLQH